MDRHLPGEPTAAVTKEGIPTTVLSNCRDQPTMVGAAMHLRSRNWVRERLSGRSCHLYSHLMKDNLVDPVGRIFPSAKFQATCETRRDAY